MNPDIPKFSAQNNTIRLLIITHACNTQHTCAYVLAAVLSVSNAVLRVLTVSALFETVKLMTKNHIRYYRDDCISTVT